MTLIERAAKRLEELRRAGAVEQEDPHSDASAKPGADDERIPTPEALVRALDAHNHEHAGSGSLRQVVAEAAGRPGERHVARPSIEIDLDRLKAMGFVTPDAPKSQIADEFRVIKRPILRNARRTSGTQVRNSALVMVTSALPGEGKTFTALNLAMSIAMEVDHRVLLVDGDVANPAIPGVLGIPSSPGLLDLLTEDHLDVGEALVRTNIEKFTVLPAGSQHRRATELLASEQMSTLLSELASRYSDRIVIFDSPPLLATTEARVLATNMGQIVMVVSSDATTQHAVKHALSTIETCPIVLMVLNKARLSDVGTYYGYYGHDDAS